jgi:hypothetical protein
MGYILLGHGGLDVDPAAIDPEMEWVAVPQGTTIQFYSDTGQGLMYGSEDLDIWSQLDTPIPAVDSSGVTYNLTLYSAKELWDDELKNNPDFAGNTLVRAGVDGVPDPIQMCTGTRDTCPTDPRQIAEGATHECDGILGTYSGELYWLACTVIENASAATEAAVDTARGIAPEDVIIGEHPDAPPIDWDNIDWQAVHDANQRVCKDASSDERLAFVSFEHLVLIGPEHPQDLMAIVDRQPTVASGTIRVKSARIGAGTMEVEGCPPEHQPGFEWAIAQFSKKTVEFL